MYVLFAFFAIMFTVNACIHYMTQGSVLKDSLSSRSGSSSINSESKEPQIDFLSPHVPFLRMSNKRESHPVSIVQLLSNEVTRTQRAGGVKMAENPGKLTSTFSRTPELHTVQRAAQLYPESCYCALVPTNKNSVCYQFTKKPYCEARKCKPSYSCVNYPTATTCMRSKVSKAIVPKKNYQGECKVVKAQGFSYSPYSVAKVRA